MKTPAPKSSESERLAFSSRLIEILHTRYGMTSSPTALLRQFNLHWPGDALTVHAVRKWLCGEAIPTQDKLRALADWLQVTPEWLRFGGDRTEGPTRIKADAETPAGRLLESFSKLSQSDREIVLGLVKILEKD